MFNFIEFGVKLIQIACLVFLLLAINNFRATPERKENNHILMVLTCLFGGVGIACIYAHNEVEEEDLEDEDPD